MPFENADELKRQLLSQQAIPKLTEMQYAVLRGFVEHLRSAGESPTMRELADALGVSPPRIQQLCTVLVKKGCMESNGKLRGMSVTGLGVDVYLARQVKEAQGTLDLGLDPDEGGSSRST